MTALLRAVRKQRGLTLDDLAERTGLTKSYLSKIERSRSSPSIATAIKVARALNVDVAQLFSEQRTEDKIAVDRAADRDLQPVRYRAIASEMLGKSMSPFVVHPAELTLDDGGADALAPHALHGGQEFLFVHTGTVELEYGDATWTLTAGDSAYIDASISHRLRTVGPQPAEVIVVAETGPR